MEKTKMLKVIADYDDNPVDVTAEVNFIWNIANKLRGTYQSDKYKDVIIPMTIIRRFECALVNPPRLIRFREYRRGFQTPHELSFMPATLGRSGYLTTDTAQTQ